MKKMYLLLLVFTNLVIAQSQLLITGIIDGDLPNGLPKALELYVIEDISDASIYGLGNANNGGGSDGQEFTFSGSFSKGDFIYVTNNATGFNTWFGFDADFVSSVANVNGDDAIELFMNGVVVDLYGDVNVNGDNEVWDYTDSWSYSNNDRSPSPTFNASQWQFAGRSALDNNGTTNSNTTTPFPTANYSNATLSSDALSIKDLEVTFFIKDSRIEIEKGKILNVYTILGQKITNDNLGKGIYIVVLEMDNRQRVVKIMI